MTLAESQPRPAGGLTAAEAAQRLAARGPVARTASSRSYASIVRANVFTVFNLILAVFGTLTLVFGDWRDALFLLVLVANASIGILQEVRAKRSLDRLALLVAPTATAVRDGHDEPLAPAQLVVGDLVRLQAGDQLLADGVVERSDGLLLDEAILTGEAEPVARRAGDGVRSGAFAVEGAGLMTVTAVGRDSYAEQLLGAARDFRHPRSPLERANNRLLLALVGAVVVLGAVLIYSLVHRAASTQDAVATATAGVVSLVPEGLVLLTSLTFAVGAVRMARRGVLAQQLNAIESLAAADTICLDKTGTLTAAALRVVALVPAAGVGAQELERQVARFAAAAPARNLTLAAIADAYPSDPEPAETLVPFSSRRRFSALRVAGDVLVLGAPERFETGALDAVVAEHTAAGRRVVALASGGPAPGDPGALPAGARVLGLVVLAEALRPDTRETVSFLRAEGVELKVLSGDAPATVAAIAADAGIETGAVVDGRELPEDPAALAEVALRATVIGRISPEDKRRVVEALRDAGRYVAMVGDGVNDVPALKASRLALAQGSGAQIARSVADLVLVHGDFGAVPAMIGEGRRSLRNLQRVARLYVAKSAFAAFLILTIGTTSTAYPLLPRHLTLAATLTVGVPTFFLALAPSSGPWRTETYARDVARFAVPAGTLVGVGVISGYLFALHDLDLRVPAARTAATTALVAAGLYLVLVLEGAGRRRRQAVGALCAVMAGVYVLALVLPWARTFFALEQPTAAIVGAGVAGAAAAITMLALAGFVPGGHPPGTVGESG
ncbi:MAG: HAD-IC family P-type ATPase [Solirubrobacteraceae bacterium]